MKTTNYEISRQLAEAGFEAEAEFYWVKWNEGEPELVHESQQTPNLIESVPTYDLETILEALPPKIENKDKFLGDWQLEITKEWIEYYYYYPSQSDVDKDSMFSCIKLHNESLADTAARLWLKLKKEGLV